MIAATPREKHLSQSDCPPVPALKAIEAKDAQGLWDAGGKIDMACENCHLKYWYPNQEESLKAALKKQKEGGQ